MVSIIELDLVDDIKINDFTAELMMVAKPV
jgi:hypothetical protein